MQRQVEIPDAVTLMLQRLELDYEGYKDIIIYILNHEDFGVNQVLFNEYQRQYLNAKYAFELAKQEIAKQYIYNDNKMNNHNCHWSLNYANNIITITEEEIA